MPLCAQRLDDRIRDRLATALALCAVAIGMTVDTPRIPILLHEGRAGIKRITTLRAKKVPRMPLRTTSHHNLALNRSLATLAPGAEALVEIQMAVEPRTLIDTILLLELRHLLRRVPAGQERDVLAALACADAVAACGVFGGGLRVEGYAFELLPALVAAEAFGVEATAAGADDAPGDGERALCALGAGADGCWCPVGAG